MRRPSRGLRLSRGRSSGSGAVFALISGLSIVMVLAGTNFSLHYFTLRGRWGRLRRDEEFRFYLRILSGATALIVVVLLAIVAFGRRYS